MATAIRLGRQRLRPEFGIGGTISYENMARQAGVMMLRSQATIPKPEQERPIEDVPELTEEQLRALASPAVAQEVIIDASPVLEPESELIDA
jgi:hypothetical protein